MSQASTPVDQSNPVVVVTKPSTDPTPVIVTPASGPTPVVVHTVPSAPALTAIGTGPKGDPGKDADLTAAGYTHHQDTPADTWTVPHSLAFVPNVTVTDTAGSVVIGAVTYVNSTTIQVSFSTAFSGIAYCS
jgi:hypothetical protein